MIATATTAAQFLLIGEVVERHGVLFTIRGTRTLDNLAGTVSYPVDNENGMPTVLTLPVGVMIPLYSRD
jgi:hypothetical protein